jgi:hypothetical protein
MLSLLMLPVLLLVQIDKLCVLLLQVFEIDCLAL